jgi:NitT/TauT family transport system substrate-binding protein
VKAFTEATHTDSTSEAISNKKVSISYPSGSFVLTNEAKTAIDNDMLPIANQFASSRIRIQGNTDDVGNPDANKVLSYKRAKSVVDYLVGQYKFNKNRFIVIGNGSKKPIADNGTEDGRAANRRTDFEVVR